MIIGRLVHSLKERCPDCGATLQLRVINKNGMQKGIEIDIPQEIIVCSGKDCTYERDEKTKRRRRLEDISL